MQDNGMEKQRNSAAGRQGVSICVSRRGFLGLAGGAAVGLVAPSARAYAASGTASSGAVSSGAVSGDRTLRFLNLHTGEKVAADFWSKGAFVPDGLAEISHVLRDHRTDEVWPIDPKLLDLLHRLHSRMDASAPFHVISGYRSPASNAMLRQKSGGVAKRSYHMQGRAIDVRLPGLRLPDMRRAALGLRGGGVGYYPKSGFLHIDTGPVRQWS